MESIIPILSLARTTSLGVVPLTGSCNQTVPNSNPVKKYYQECEEQDPPLICYDVFSADDLHVCLDACAADPCTEPHQICQLDNSDNGYNCNTCEPGWNGAGCSNPTCDPPSDPTQNHPCFGRGNCTGINQSNTNSPWICTTPCTSNPCQNNAVCHSYTDYTDYQCDCTAGFTGRNCETSLSKCNPNPCKNGAQCTDLNDFSGFICTCEQNWFGPDCSEALLCTTAPCKNGGICHNWNNNEGYCCECQRGWDGETCEVESSSSLSALVSVILILLTQFAC